VTPPTLPPSGGARSAGAAQDPFVERLADERVGEADSPRRRRQEMRLDRPLDRGDQRLFRETADRAPQIERDILADHGRQRQRLARFLAQARDPPVDHLLDQRRHPHPAEVAEVPAGTVRP